MENFSKDVLLFSIILVIITPIISIAEIIFVLTRRKLNYWIKSTPLPWFFINKYIILFLWFISMVIYSIIFCLDQYKYNILLYKFSPLLDFYLICNIIGYVILYIWPFFLFYFRNINLAFVIIINSYIYLILYSVFYILYNISKDSTIPGILILIGIFYLYLFHLYSILIILFTIINIDNDML